MDGDRIRQALARIEAAGARPAPSSSGETTDLERRHAALRSETGAALQELDRLIEGLER